MMLCYRRKLSGLTVGLFVVDPGLWLVLLFFQRLAYRWTILGTEDKVINLSFSCSHSDIVSILFYSFPSWTLHLAPLLSCDILPILYEIWRIPADGQVFGVQDSEVFLTMRYWSMVSAEHMLVRLSLQLLETDCWSSHVPLCQLAEANLIAVGIGAFRLQVTIVGEWLYVMCYTRLLAFCPGSLLFIMFVLLC